MNQFSGIITAAIANLLWGLSPLYYSKLGDVSPAVLLCAQVMLTFLVLAALQGVRAHETTRAALLRACPTAALIGLNWAAYVAAVMHGKALQASYAYLIAPIITVLLAAVVFREAMSARQAVGIVLSLAAVGLDVAWSREFPVLGVLIALPFAGYVVLHKKLGSDNPVKALKQETMLLLPFAVMALPMALHSGGAAPMSGLAISLLALIGVVNAMPLLLFIRAAPSLSPSQLGACQFIAPITSAVLSHFAFAAKLDGAKCLVFALLSLGMACAIMPAKARVQAAGG